MQPMNPLVRQYRLLPSSYPEAEKRMLRRNLVPQLCVMAAVVIVSLVLSARTSQTPAALAILVVTSVALLTYMAIIPRRRVRRVLPKLWQTYVLEIGPDYLLRRQADTPDIHLRFQDVKRIEHLPGRYLRVIGNSSFQVIGIPEDIDQLAEIRQTLEAIAPITKRRADRNLNWSVLLALGFAGWIVMLWSSSPRVVLPVGAVVTGMLIWLFVYLQRSPNVPQANRRGAWVYLILAGLCLLRLASVLRRLW